MPYKDPEVRKAYQRDYQQQWYADPVNRAGHLRRVKVNNVATMALFAERVRQIKSKPCMDCDGTFDPVCMDFDHREGEEKLSAVSAMIASNRYGWARIEAEIAKCDVVCANCHRLRTKARLEARSSVRSGVVQRQDA